MLRQIKTLIIIFFTLIFFQLNVNAAEILDINYLIEHARELDGKEVTIKGEAVGEQLERKDFSWININDGTNAIGIWTKNDDANAISNYGSYKYKGDTIIVTGIFYRACSKHGGEADIHSMSLKVTEKGHLIHEQVSSEKIIRAALICGLSILLFLFYYRSRNNH